MLKLCPQESIFTMQKCCLSSDLLDSLCRSDQVGRYAIVKISPHNHCVCKLVWKKDLHSSFFEIDTSVTTFTDSTDNGFPCQPVTSTYNLISLQDMQVFPKAVTLKSLTVSVVFEKPKSVKQWRKDTLSLLQIIKNILSLYIVTDSSVVYVKNLTDTSKFGINCIIIHCCHRQKSDNSPFVGRVSFSTKMNIKKLLSKDRFIQIQNYSGIHHLGGLDGPCQILKEIINQQNQSRGIKYCNQVLLVGPSGCGKTSVVHKVAKECGAVLLIIQGPQVCSPKPGDTEKKVREIFQEAFEFASEGNCILLLDEVDSLCPKTGQSESNSHIRRITVQVVTLLEEADNVQGLVVIGTTNRPFAIDPAIRRPGCLEMEIYIGVPTECQRTEILSILIKPMLSQQLEHKASDLCKSVASFTPGYVGADLSLLCQHVAHQCFLQKKEISHLSLDDWLEDFRKAAAMVRPSSIRTGVGIVTVQPQSMSNIGGLEHIKQALQVAVEWPLKHPEAFARLALPHPRGVLLYGPPGCAKTTIARALATNMNTTFLSVSAAELYSPFVGDAERTVVELFHRARLGAPSILFIDEIDALVGKRFEKETGVKDRVLSAFLTEMDGIGIRLEARLMDEDANECNKCNVMVIAATNRPDLLDDAILRPGRFDKILYVPPPNTEDRQSILKILLAKTPLDSSVNIEEISKATELFSGADLSNLCREAALHALTEKGMEVACVEHKHFLLALKQLSPSLNHHLVNWYERYNIS